MRKIIRRKKRPEVMTPTKILNETSEKSENVRTSWIIKTEISAGRFTMGQLLTAIHWNLTEDKNNLKFVYKILIFFHFLTHSIKTRRIMLIGSIWKRYRLTVALISSQDLKTLATSTNNLIIWLTKSRSCHRHSSGTRFLFNILCIKMKRIQRLSNLLDYLDFRRRFMTLNR